MKKHLLAIAMTGLGLTDAQAIPSYYLVDLGRLSGDNYAAASDINAVGQVVGESGTRTNGSTTTSRAFLWTPNTPNASSGSMVDLGSLANIPPGLIGNTYRAEAINTSGQVVVTANHLGLGGIGSSDPGILNAFLWTPNTANGSAGTQTLISGFPAGYAGNDALGLNDNGVVVGDFSNTTQINHGYRWSQSGGVSDLGDLTPSTSVANNFSRAFAINNAGQVVGGSITSSTPTNYNLNAVLWQSGTICPSGCTALGDIPGGEVSAIFTNVNEAGTAVGQGTNASGMVVAILWMPNSPNGNGGSFTTIGTLPGDLASNANDINASNQVVGDRQLADESYSAIYWSASDGLHDLNTLINPGDPLKTQTILRYATGINDSGQIAAVGEDLTTGEIHAYLLTTTAPSTGGGEPTQVPMPLVAVLSLAALFGGTGLRRLGRGRRALKRTE
jgi:probable HAF family extracellular repeat protein